MQCANWTQQKDPKNRVCRNTVLLPVLLVLLVLLLLLEDI